MYIANKNRLVARWFLSHASYFIGPVVLLTFSCLAFGPVGCGGSSGSGGAGGGTPAAESGTVEVLPAGVWVSNNGTFSDATNNTVMRIDPASSAVVMTFAAEGKPASATIQSKPYMLIFCNGSVWVESDPYESLDQISPTSNSVVGKVDDMPADGGVACAGNQIWAGTKGSRTLKRYNTDERSLNSVELDASVAGVAATQNGVWSADSSAKLRQFDSSSGVPGVTISLNTASTSYMPLGMTGSGDFVWVVAQNNTTNKIALIKANVKEKKLVLSRDLEIPGLSDTDLALGARLDVVESGGSVWFPAASLNKLVRVDSNSLSVITTTDVGAKPIGVASGFNSIWVANSESNTVTRVDEATGGVQTTIPVGIKPSRITVSK